MGEPIDKPIIIRNPNFVTDTEWAHEANWVISGGTARWVKTVPTYWPMTQFNLPFIANTTYTFRFEMVDAFFANAPAAGLIIRLEDVSSIKMFTPGWHEVSITATVNSNRLTWYALESIIGDLAEIDHISVINIQPPEAGHLGINWPSPRMREPLSATIADHVTVLASYNGKTNCLIAYNDV